MTEPAPPVTALELGLNRLVFVVSGSACATGAPYWLDWLRACYPDIKVHAVLTRSALRFVTAHSVDARVSKLWFDEWPDDDHRARHVELTEWAHAFVVYPATMHYFARLALGLADTPSLLALQCTTVPVAVAPALPPGGMHATAFETHWSTLVRREHVALAAPGPGPSATTARDDAWLPPMLPDVLAMLEHRRAELAGERARLASPAVGGEPR